MSNNITIQEGNRGKNFTAGKLKTALQGGGSCLWVPEAEVQLESVDIDRNGTVTAASRGVYGFDEVYVYVVNQHGISGKDPDTGEDVYIDVDGSETILPESIAVGIQPVRKEYENGQRISIYGMSVYAYDAQGNRWEGAGYPNGLIPNGELSISPQVADASQASGGEEYSGGEAAYPWPDSIATTGGISYNTQSSTTYIVRTAGKMAARWNKVGGTAIRYILASAAPGVVGRELCGQNVRDITTNNTFTYDGKTVYFAITSSIVIDYGYGYSGTINNPVSGSTYQADSKVAWKLIYGTETKKEGTQTITVSWPRPGDGKLLSTSFEITVQS